MSEGVWVPLGPPQPPEVLLRDSLVDQTSRIEELLSYLPRARTSNDQTEALAQLIVATAESQLALVRLVLQKYH